MPLRGFEQLSRRTRLHSPFCSRPWPAGPLRVRESGGDGGPPCAVDAADGLRLRCRLGQPDVAWPLNRFTGRQIPNVYSRQAAGLQYLHQLFYGSEGFSLDGSTFRIPWE